MISKNKALIIGFDQITISDIARVGGKNASLGEMIKNLTKSQVLVPGGFATTAEAYVEFLKQNGLDEKIYQALSRLDVNDLSLLNSTAKEIQKWILNQTFIKEFEDALQQAYEKLAANASRDFSVAVRSSATAEDLPEASFAGQQETFLNVRTFQELLACVKRVYASLFTERAITYRVHHHFSHRDVAISVGVQYMVRSDLASSGVAFSMDTESGFQDVVFITSGYGLGELLVQGAINPDEFYVYKPNIIANRPAILRRTLGTKHKKMVFSKNPNELVTTLDVPLHDRRLFSLNDEEITLLADQVMKIEKHYGRAMDVEWAKDGNDGKIYIVQARPETVKSHANQHLLERYRLEKHSTVLVKGRSIGQKIGSGRAKVIHTIKEMDRLKPGDVLVAEMTDPDWEPIMKRASAIVTNRGGRTCHAAIIARELGIPAVVGTQDGTQRISDQSDVTVSCAEGEEGYVYEGRLPFEIDRLDVKTLPELPLKVMLNVGNPDKAFTFRSIPNSGVGLARIEFVISNFIGIHPQALLHYDELEDSLRETIAEKISGYSSPTEFYISKLTEGIATLAAAFAPHPVIVRLSDFKSNEYANLIGGEKYEPEEENPMIGFRGASRYVSESFRECFALECKAVKRVRNDMGLTNVEVMIPFVRTVNEAAEVVKVLEAQGLKRGENGLRLIMMCEVPSNALLAEQFLQYFDGFSIDSNDLTQLTLGLDRDSSLVSSQFDERNEAVKILLHYAISACRKAGKYIGICGQGPSDHKDFAEWLMEEGIESVSLNPDSVLETCLYLAKHR